MSHSPPVPEGNQSPYPIQEPPHPPVAANLPVVVSDDDSTSLTDRLRDLPLIAIGAVVGLGAALIGGALWGLGRATPGRRGKRKARGV